MDDRNLDKTHIQISDSELLCGVQDRTTTEEILLPKDHEEATCEICLKRLRNLSHLLDTYMSWK